MLSERLQRQVDRLLDQAEEAATQESWERVRELCHRALTIDPENGDARGFLLMAAESVVGDTSAAIEELAAAQRTPEVPASFVGGRYKVSRFLGEGGKKKVYLAHDELLDRDVAFSLIKTHGLDETGRERILREAQAMGRLSHPNVVAIYDMGEQEGQPYIVQELMGGGDVEGLLEDASGPLPVEQSLEIAKATCRGLAFAHEQGVVHRDLKPGNVWLAGDGTAKLGDFGLAVQLGRSRLTQHGMMVGTFGYMPPEQALGGEVTAQSDLYSLGAMLYELVTGRVPFPGDDPTAVISQHINQAPVAPSWHTERCPPELEGLILRLLEKEPARRPASAAEVLEALDRVDPEARSLSHSQQGANPLERLARGVFVGRERELERLRTALDEALRGRGSLVMLVGEPGIGKTRTAQELETYARMRGAQTFWGKARESASAPAYWPWVQVGRAYSASVDRDLQREQLRSHAVELQRLMPQVREVFEGLPEAAQADDSSSAQFRLFDAFTTWLRAAADATPTVVVLDDLHWADKPSLLLLQHLAHELSRSRLLVIGTYRDTELARTHPLSAALAEMNRVDAFERVNLRELSRDEVAEYVREAASTEPARELLDRIYEETEGNPFFLSEVVNLMTEEGKLDADSVSDIVIPEGVREALGRRFDRLSEEANEFLTTAAVVGREFTYATMGALTGRPDDELLRLVEEGLAARVIQETDEAGRYTFAHALTQETLLSELSTTRRVREHGRVAEVLEKRYGEDPTRAARLAFHYLESTTLNREHAEKAGHYSRIAGEQAEAQFAWAEAARHYQNAIDQGSTGIEEAELLTRLAHCLGGAAEFRGAWPHLRRAVELHEASGNWNGMARAALELRAISGDARDSLALLDHVLDAGGQRDQTLEGSLLALRAGWNATEGLDLERAEADASQARRLLESGDSEAQEWAATVLAPVQASRLFHSGDFTAAGALLGELRAQWIDVVGAPWVGSGALLVAGDLPGAEAAYGSLLESARRRRLAFVEQVSVGGLGCVAVLQGDFRRARELAESIAGSFTSSVLLSVCDATQGLDPAPVDAGARPGPVSELIRRAVNARALLAVGNELGARRAVSDWATLLSESGLELLHAGPLAFGDPPPELMEESVARRVLTELGPLDQLQVLGWESAAAIFGEVALRLGETDEAWHRFTRGVEWCTQADCPIELGRNLQGLAAVSALRGNAAEARGYLDRAGDLFSRHGAKLYLDQVLAKKEILKA